MKNKVVENSPNKESTLKIFRILADKVPVVTEYLSEKILSNTKNDAYIAWLTTGKNIEACFNTIVPPLMTNHK